MKMPATAVLSETFSENNDRWLDIYRDVICGYDSVAKLTEQERRPNFFRSTPICKGEGFVIYL